ncbi:MAG: thermonuclease family protein [Rubellimicrobium sp.]|nr:thermonuclease family protein [Rubellimicrobium sp.]
MFRLRSILSVAALAGTLFLVALGRPDASEPPPERLTGVVQVTDGDSIRLEGHATRIRLFGIDAPEGEQTCRNAHGADWACGGWVTLQVRARFEGASATCERRDTDRFGRMVAVCRVDGRDMNEEIVREGWAVAYRQFSSDYVGAETAARSAGAGLWSHEFIEPAVFRREGSVPQPDAPRHRAGQDAPGDCNIKGNISSNGRIYHMPHNRDYDRTIIDETQGERWFCTPEEAEAAGWRAARN